MIELNSQLLARTFAIMSPLLTDVTHNLQGDIYETLEMFANVLIMWRLRNLRGFVNVIRAAKQCFQSPQTLIPMKKLLFLLAGFCFLPFLLQSCKDKKDDCQCRDLEDCIDGECILQENTYYINNQGVKAHYLYHGVVKGNTCLDSLIFTLNLSDPNPLTRFGLYANVSPWGLYNVTPSLISKISDKEYVIGSGTTICRQNGKELYASSIHCLIEPDSVVMNIRFREWFDTTDVYVDSCKVTLYH